MLYGVTWFLTETYCTQIYLQLAILPIPFEAWLAATYSTAHKELSSGENSVRFLKTKFFTFLLC